MAGASFLAALVRHLYPFLLSRRADTIGPSAFVRHRSLTCFARASVGRKTASGQKIPLAEPCLGEDGLQSQAASRFAGVADEGCLGCWIWGNWGGG